MKYTWIFLLLTFQALANGSVRVSTSKPCSSWRYSSDARGYICNSPGFYQAIANGNDVVQELIRLNRLVSDLERRVEKLEASSRD